MSSFPSRPFPRRAGVLNLPVRSTITGPRHRLPRPGRDLGLAGQLGLAEPVAVGDVAASGPALLGRATCGPPGDLAGADRAGALGLDGAQLGLGQVRLLAVPEPEALQLARVAERGSCGLDRADERLVEGVDPPDHHQGVGGWVSRLAGLPRHGRTHDPHDT